jgi:hypothetical protein
MKSAVSLIENNYLKRIQISKLLLCSLLLFFSANSLLAQKDTIRNSTKDTNKIVIDPVHGLFGPSDPMHITLKFDLNDFYKKRANSEYLDADVTLRFNNSDSVEHHIKIRPSGVFRRSYCYIPPIQLKFKGSEFQSKDIGEQRTIKLVTHCKNARANTVYVLREYLAYRLYNIITPYSLQVRLVYINYVDKKNPKKRFTRYGFLIENSEGMAERTHTILQRDPKYTNSNILMEQVIRVGVFEYMIGNTDWAASLLHNIKLLELPDGHRIYLPHDFDYSGFVGSDYAIPDPALGITDVKERIYMGRYENDETFERTLKEFDGYKTAFYKLIQDFEMLSIREKKETLSYLDEFFDLLKDKPALIITLRKNSKEYIH